MQANEPTPDERQGEPDAEPHAQPESRPRRVLLADDNFATRELLRRMLRPLVDAELHDARDGDTALEQFHLLKPSLTFLDIDMPGQDGLAVLEGIRATDAAAPVIMVSGHSRVDVVQKAVALGIAGYLVKPFSEQRLAQVLAKAVAAGGDAGLLRR